MRGRMGIAAVAAALVTAGVGGAQTFSDPVGDTPGPDISSVDVTTDAQNLVATVALANRSALADGEAVESTSTSTETRPRATSPASTCTES